MDLNIQNVKIELIQWLITSEDAATLKKLLNLRESEDGMMVHNLSDAENTEIEEGLQDLKNGNVVPHSEAKKIYGKWL